MKNELPIMPIRAMYAEKSSEGKNLDEGGEVDPSTLYGKFVRIVDASAINPSAITDEQLDDFKNGFFVNGDILGVHCPVFCPAVGANDVYSGVCITSEPGAPTYGSIVSYVIANRQLTIRSYGISFVNNGIDIVINSHDFNMRNGSLNISDIVVTRSGYLLGKQYPAYPAVQTDKTYALELVNGTLTWVEETA